MRGQAQLCAPVAGNSRGNHAWFIFLITITVSYVTGGSLLDAHSYCMQHMVALCRACGDQGPGVTRRLCRACGDQGPGARCDMSVVSGMR